MSTDAHQISDFMAAHGLVYYPDRKMAVGHSGGRGLYLITDDGEYQARYHNKLEMTFLVKGESPEEKKVAHASIDALLEDLDKLLGPARL